MKLRNKKTGEIVTKIDVSQDNESIWIFGNKVCLYKTLAAINEEWEDYKPKEPLIGDEIERELVREWASAYAITTVWAERVKDSCLIKLIDADESRRSIVIDSYATIANGQYAIAELCGEEEE